MQIAKHLGARVTAVCGPTNVDMVRSIGADAVLDYTKDTLPTGVVYDRVFDAVGRSKTSALKVAARNAVAAKGAFVSVDDKLPRLRRDDLGDPRLTSVVTGMSASHCSARSARFRLLA